MAGLTAGAVVALLSAVLPPCRGETKPGPIVLIVIDTLRADHLGCYGYSRDTSPAMDALARRGVRFHRAISQAPWTLPSVASLLTSQYPSELGVTEAGTGLPESARTLAEALKENGYTTAGVVSHSFCSSATGFGQGFDHFDERSIRARDDEIVGQRVTSAALEMLDRVRADGKPIFLFVHYFDPHSAYLRHEEFSFRDAAYEGPIGSGMRARDFRLVREELTAADFAEIARIYDSEIAYTDHQIGRLLKRLKRDHLYKDATIIVTADHGEEFDDHGRFGHTRTLYEELVRVPLIVKCPRTQSYERCAAGSVVDEPVSLVDVFPTVLELAGLAADASLEGTSLVARPGDEARPAFSESSSHVELRGVVLGRHKLIRDLETDSIEFFDTSADPAERAPLDPESIPEATRLRTLLGEWTGSLSPPADPRTVEMDEAERERLKALGYLESDEPADGEAPRRDAPSGDADGDR